MEDNELFGERHEQEENGLYGKKHAELCVLYDVVGSQFTDLREPWIDPNEPVVNYKKHKQTCAKNRKKRKNKRRR
tara:strand:+ start:13212 stop:13436 length:225 start_codon:yes stop_codon:yes gene_type:complete